MDKKAINILFTSVGRRVELMEAFRKAADKIQMKLTIFGVDISMTAPAMYFCDKKIQICRIDHQDYIPQLLHICEENRIDALIPTIDTDLLILAKYKQEFENIGTKVYVSAEDKVKVCRDKRVTGDFFELCGLQAPKAYGDIKMYMGEYPAFVKPLDGSSSINAYKVSNREELEEYCNKIGKYVIQPYIEGTEYTIDIFAITMVRLYTLHREKEWQSEAEKYYRLRYVRTIR